MHMCTCVWGWGGGGECDKNKRYYWRRTKKSYLILLQRPFSLCCLSVLLRLIFLSVSVSLLHFVCLSVFLPCFPPLSSPSRSVTIYLFLRLCLSPCLSPTEIYSLSTLERGGDAEQEKGAQRGDCVGGHLPSVFVYMRWEEEALGRLCPCVQFTFFWLTASPLIRKGF